MWGGFFEQRDFDGDEILPGVYLGSYDAACADFKEFESRNIKFVLQIGYIFEFCKAKIQF
jgi:hypothetical protein